MGCASSKSAAAAGDDLNSTERVMQGRRGIDKSERIHNPSERARLALQRARAVASATSGDGGAPQSPLPPPKLNEAGHLVAEEVVKRISGSVETKDVILGDLRSENPDEGIIHLSYAAMTQRGYYPNDPHKENQDAYYLCPSKFASGEGDAFFAVFDGHGDRGGDCASFAADNLHSFLARGLRKERAARNAAGLREIDASGGTRPKDAFHPSGWPYLDVKAYEGCCREAHLQCNKAMHDDKAVSSCALGSQNKACDEPV